MPGEAIPEKRSKKLMYGLLAVIVIAVVAIATYMLMPKAQVSVTDITLGTQVARVNEVFNLVVTVSNTGSAEADYKLELKVDGQVRETRMLKIAAGNVTDVAFNLTETTPGTHTISAGDKSTSIRVINPIFADIRFRQAIVSVFDYQSYISDILKYGGIVPNGPVPKGMFGYSETTPPRYEYNLTKARELLSSVLADYGFSTSNPLRITFYYNEGNTVREKACLLLASALQNLKVGIEATAQALAWPQYLQAMRESKLPVFFLGWAPDFIDPDDYLVPFLHSERGSFPLRTSYANPEVDRLIDLQSAILDPSERVRVIQQISMMSYNDVPYLWEAQVEGIHFERSWIQGWFYNPAFAGYYYATISKAPGASNPDQIIMESIGEPDYLDPAVDYETAGGEVIQNVFENLFYYDGSNSSKVIPWLAESYEVSPDGTSYTIHLRRGIKFHDGTPFNATAVKYSLERAIIIADPDGPAWMLDVIKGAGDLMYNKIWKGTATWDDIEAWRAQKPIEVIDDYTVRINLERPYAPFPSVLAYAVCAIVSPSYVEAHGGIEIGKHNEWVDRNAAAGTGPYMFESWEAGTVILRRNPNYWGGPKTGEASGGPTNYVLGRIQPKIERVIIKTIPDANTRLTDLLSGACDFAAISRDHWPQLIDFDHWVSTHEVKGINPDIRAIGPLPTFDLDFLGINFRY
jgi:ABC-type transport system substrate-binding protein